ncbi:MAG: metFprotein [Actinophytocola sp.]|nr:metFprotein [Actinophytocola sp.]
MPNRPKDPFSQTGDVANLSDVVRSLTAGLSVEMTPRDVRKEPGLCEQSLPAGTRVYLTFLPRSPFGDTVKAAMSLIDQGMRPVPHIAARGVADAAELDRMVGELADVGVRELLVVAGSIGTPKGTFTDTMQVLRSGVLERHGITRVGVAGHPEGSPDIDVDALETALREKNVFAAEAGCEMYLLTQFCFAARPIVAWERRIRAAGNWLPIYIGLPGLTSPRQLLKFGLACGVGPSLKVLRNQTGGVLSLATTSAYYPDQTLLGLASAVRTDQASLISGVHFFPFGATASTADWAKQIADGQFRIDDRQGRLAVTA